jgi:predicted deacylase
MKHTVVFEPLSTMVDGSRSGVHIHDLAGDLGEGPTLGISGVIHGDEVTGAHILLDLFRLLKNTPFRGRLRLLPVANPHGFAAVERFTTIDRVNLNRVFPGNPKGTYSEQLADHIMRVFFNTVDVLVDLHSGTDRPTVDYSYIFNDEALARSTGLKILYRPENQGRAFVGTSAVAVLDRNVPVTVIELGGGVIDQAPYARRGVDALFNVMRHLGMLDGDVERHTDQVIVKDIKLVRPTQGGFIETEAPALGERISGGSVLGRIVSPYTFEELEILSNPVTDGIMILSHLTRNIIEPGDYAYMVGDLDGSES